MTEDMHRLQDAKIAEALNQIRAVTEPMALLLSMGDKPTYREMLQVFQGVNRSAAAALATLTERTT